MPGQNNQYGSQDDPFGYGSQQQYWKNVQAKPVPVKMTVPTTPQVQPRPTPEGPPVYQSPYGRGYVPPNGGSQQIPNPGAAQVPVPPSQLPQWAVQPMPPNGGTWNWQTQPVPSPIYNGPVPPKQPLPDDIYGFSKTYGAPIPEGQTWNQWNPRGGYPTGGWQQPQWGQQQPVPQWYTARLQQQR